MTSTVACEFSEGETYPKISQNPKTSEKEKWRNPYFANFKLEARGREIARKT